MKRKPSFGFSLIEILVVMGILGILMAVGVASYNRMNDRSKLEQAAQLLATELRELQKRADSGTSTCAPDKAFGGVEVRREDNVTIKYFDICDGDMFEVGTYQLINDVTMANFANFTFKSLGRGVGSNEDITITRGGADYKVSITSAGGISVGKS